MPVAALEPIAPAVPSAHAIPLDALPAGPFAPDLAPPVAKFVGPVVTSNQFAADPNGHHFVTPTNPNASPFPVCPDPALLASHLDAVQSRLPLPRPSGFQISRPSRFTKTWPTGGGSSRANRRRFLPGGARRFIDIRAPFWSEHLLNKHKSNKLGYNLYTDLSSKFHV